MTLDTGNILMVGSILLFISIIAGKAGYKFGVPMLLLFLGVGMFFGSDGLGIQFNSPSAAQFIGMIALSIILFSGGMDTKYSEIKPVAVPGIILATLGVMLTALLTGGLIYCISGILTGVPSLTFTESLLLASVMTLALLSGCSKDTGSSSGNSGKGKDSLVVGNMSETPSMGPYDHNAVAGDYMNKLTYSTLFRTDADLNPEPSLVDTYENTSDTEWVFHLRQGVKSHDGSEMTADDVVASIEYAKTCPEVNLYNRCILTVEAVDNYTVKIVTDGPSATLLYDLCHHANAILPNLTNNRPTIDPIYR